MWKKLNLTSKKPSLADKDEEQHIPTKHETSPQRLVLTIKAQEWEISYRWRWFTQQLEHIPCLVIQQRSSRSTCLRRANVLQRQKEQSSPRAAATRWESMLQYTGGNRISTLAVLTQFLLSSLTAWFYWSFINKCMVVTEKVPFKACSFPRVKSQYCDSLFNEFSYQAGAWMR